VVIEFPMLPNFEFSWLRTNIKLAVTPSEMADKGRGADHTGAIPS
jgi:hypothetical protein